MSTSDSGGNTPEVKQGSGVAGSRLKLRAVNAWSWQWPSIRHAQTAVLMAKKCSELEMRSAKFTQGSPDRVAALAEHWASASSSLVASVMFLEAHINELFRSAAFAQELKDFPAVGGLLSDRDQQKLSDTWDMVEKMNLLDKHIFALHLLDRDPISKGAPPFQQVALLVKARNELVHPKEGAHKVGRDLVKLERALKDNLGGTSFVCHPYTSEGNAFFPDQFLGYAGCRWAWESVDAFAQEFRASLGIDPAYQQSRQKLAF